jgi:hypothetical protein
MMTLFVVRAEPDTAPETSPVGELLNAIGLTARLPERLTQDAAGRSFEPVQLSPSPEVVQQVTLLLRRESIGGAEPLIRDTGRQLREQALGQLNRALAGTSASTRSFLHDLLVETRVRMQLLTTPAQQIEQTYARTQERLQHWQDQAGQRSGSLGADLWRWLVGGHERLSLPEVIALWNQRESQAVQRAATAEALAIVGWFLDTIQNLLTNLDELLAQARRLHAAAEADVQRLRRPAPSYAPWTAQLDTRVIAEALLGPLMFDGLLAELLRRMTEAGGATALAGQIQELAHREAERHLTALSITDLIELEARAAGIDPDGDPLVLVGQALLDALGRPIWQVTRNARPRIETLQVTPDGAPIYSMDGLGSAAYGAGAERLGFVAVQLGVAKDELALVRDGDEAFQHTLAQRNLYVLDDLAQGWENAHPATEPAPASMPAEQPQRLNGRLDAVVESAESVRDA